MVIVTAACGSTDILLILGQSVLFDTGMFLSYFQFWLGFYCLLFSIQLDNSSSMSASNICTTRNNTVRLHYIHCDTQRCQMMFIFPVLSYYHSFCLPIFLLKEREKLVFSCFELSTWTSIKSCSFRVFHLLIFPPFREKNNMKN